MKKITILTVLAIMIALSTNAAVWRVNNNTQIDADFYDLQEAINDVGVQPFDTIYLEASNTSYGSIDVEKPIIIIGVGYFLIENDSTQAIKSPSIIDDIDFMPGSEGSKLYGCFFSLRIASGCIKIGADNITISRNMVYVIVQEYNTAVGISIYSNDISIIIENNYLDVYNNSRYSTTIQSNNIGLNLILRNNYISGEERQDYTIAMDLTETGNTYEIRNNVFNGLITCYSGIFLNNIMIDGSISGSNNIYNNNIGNSTQFSSTNGNQENIDMTTVFVDHQSGVDNGLILKAGSPAIGAGFSGEDCGLFGGNTPYVLSGIPPIPAIFEIENDGVGNSVNPIQVNLKAKSNR